LNRSQAASENCKRCSIVRTRCNQIFCRTPQHCKHRFKGATAYSGRSVTETGMRATHIPNCFQICSRLLPKKILSCDSNMKPVACDDRSTCGLVLVGNSKPLFVRISGFRFVFVAYSRVKSLRNVMLVHRCQ
jgi:hypothetical protein